MKNIITGAALLLASSSSYAGLIQTTETDEFGIQGSSQSVNINNLNEVLSVAGFNASLGSLYSVTVNLYGQIDSNGSIQNNLTDLSRASLDILLSKDWLVSSSFGTDYTFANAFSTIWSGESSAVGTYTLGQGDIFSYSATSGEMFQSITFTGSDLSFFTTGNNVDFTFTTDIINNFQNQSTGASNDFTNKNTTASWGKVEVSYSYDNGITTVSEPGTLAILALGLMGFAASRKNKSV
ncbi:choice-of-anchor E domain-containing protein [Thalassotalea piscium]